MGPTLCRGQNPTVQQMIVKKLIFIFTICFSKVMKCISIFTTHFPKIHSYRVHSTV